MAYKFLILFTLLCVAPLSLNAQAPCTFDFAATIALLENNPTLDQVAEARALIQLQEANCRDYAPDDAGSSRTNPVPFGQSQQVEVDEFFGSIQIVEYIDDAQDYVLAANDRNDPAPDGTRYIAFRLRYTCEKPASESCDFIRIYFSVVGNKGVAYDYSSADNYDIRIRDIGEEQEIFGGTTIEVDVAFLVDADDDNFILYTEYGDRVFFASE